MRCVLQSLYSIKWGVRYISLPFLIQIKLSSSYIKINIVKKKCSWAFNKHHKTPFSFLLSQDQSCRLVQIFHTEVELLCLLLSFQCMFLTFILRISWVLKPCTFHLHRGEWIWNSLFMSPCAYSRIFFLLMHCMKEPLPCTQFWFSQYFDKAGGFTKVQKKKIGRVLQCFHCNGKSINPSLQTVMKARLRVTLWESEGP